MQVVEELIEIDGYLESLSHTMNLSISACLRLLIKYILDLPPVRGKGFVRNVNGLMEVTKRSTYPPVQTIDDLK